MLRAGSADDSGFYIKLAATFVNEGEEIWNLTDDDHAWSLFMNNSWQTVSLIGHEHPLLMITDDVDGNRMAYFEFQSGLGPGEGVSDYVVYHVRSRRRSIPNVDFSASGTVDAIPTELKEKYCGGGGFWLIEDLQIRERALAIIGDENNVLKIVAKLVSWIWSNIEYKTHDPILYPNETLSMSEGDCDEQAILFSTFCRVIGIPSYVQVGCIFQPGAYVSDSAGQVHYVLNQIGWHGWSIVYVPPWGWLPVDLTYVTGSMRDPLNSIRQGAVMSPYTIQSMNVSENDYLMSDRMFSDLLVQHSFSLYTADEMGEANPLLGDLNGDNVVNIIDVAVAAKAFRSTPHSQNWNSLADVNKDDQVTIADVTIVALQLGNRC
jgi:hypothetical protein